jgi:glutamyl-tRNA reductase
VIQPDQVKGIIRKRRNRPLFFMDIAVPRDIDPEINRLANSYVYDIDDLKGIIDENIDDRRKEAIKGERIVDEAVIHFRKWHESLDIVPTIIALRSKMESIAEAELKKTLQSSKISEQESEAIHKMTGSLINKILHDPTLFLKQNGMREDKSFYIDTVRKLFKLDE